MPADRLQAGEATEPRAPPAVYSKVCWPVGTAVALAGRRRDKSATGSRRYGGPIRRSAAARRTHDLVLLCQPTLMQTLALSVNAEIRSRITYSVLLPRLLTEDIEAVLLRERTRILVKGGRDRTCHLDPTAVRFE